MGTTLFITCLCLSEAKGMIKNMKITLKTNALCKKFKGELVVDNVSMNVRCNSIYGLLGPNGAGKSTLLKMISGMTIPSSGGILLNGHEWERKDLKKVGALIENPPLYENLTAYENLKVRTLALGLPEHRITEVLNLVQLADTGRKKTRNFSMGMKQRLGIALALLGKPELVILDEPTNGLDPIAIYELRKLIRSFPTQGITIILSSHILSEIEQIADDIGIIADGKLKYENCIEKNSNLEQIFMRVVAEMESEG